MTVEVGGSRERNKRPEPPGRGSKRSLAECRGLEKCFKAATGQEKAGVESQGCLFVFACLF